MDSTSVAPPLLAPSPSVPLCPSVSPCVLIRSVLAEAGWECWQPAQLGGKPQKFPEGQLLAAACEFPTSAFLGEGEGEGRVNKAVIFILTIRCVLVLIGSLVHQVAFPGTFHHSSTQACSPAGPGGGGPKAPRGSWRYLEVLRGS